MPDELKVSPAPLKPYWARRDMFAMNLLLMFIDSYGVEGLQWLPETIEMEIAADFHVDIDDASFERLLTAIAILTTDTFTTSLPDFARSCVVLSGNSVSADVMSLPDSEDIAWGITEALLISPPEQDNVFNEEIVGFIGATLDNEGILTPPDVLKIAQRPELRDQVSYDFSDDPEMFEAIWQTEKSKSGDIDTFVRSRMESLLEQMRELPLANGKTEFVKKVLAKFRQR